MTEINEEDLKKNVKDKDTWLRFVYLVLFAAVFYIVILITFAVSLFQFLAKLFSGSSFPSVSEFGKCLAIYQACVIRFLTFSSDDKPFPFAPFPTSDCCCCDCDCGCEKCKCSKKPASSQETTEQ